MVLLARNMGQVGVVDRGEALALLAAGDGAARVTALGWLGAHAPEALAGEHAALLHDADLAVREAAVVVLRAAPNAALAEAARRGMRDLVLSPELAHRHAGLRAAAVLANPTLAPRLFPFLADPDAETRRLALLALAAVPHGLLAPTLLRDHAASALTDQDAGVREAARTLLATDD